MTKVKIAIQGELGAYSHIAVNEVFKNAEIKTCSTFEETFKVAFEDESYKIIIPLENSLAGRNLCWPSLFKFVSWKSLSLEDSIGILSWKSLSWGSLLGISLEKELSGISLRNLPWKPILESSLGNLS